MSPTAPAWRASTVRIEAAVPRIAGVQLRHVADGAPAGPNDATRGRACEAQQDAEQRALPGAVGPGERDELPASHVEWSVAQVRKGGDATVYAYVHVGVCDRAEGIEAVPGSDNCLRRDIREPCRVDGLPVRSSRNRS